MWRKDVWRDPVERSEKPRDFVGVEDPGPEVSVPQGSRRSRRHLDEDALPLEEAGELANNADACDVGRGSLVRSLRDPHLDHRPRQRDLVVAALDEETIDPLKEPLLDVVPIADGALLEDEVTQPRGKG
jgi:hypothetical protein